MRDLDKIKSKRVSHLAMGKVTILLATGIIMGIMVFLGGLFLGLRKPASIPVSPIDPIDALLAGTQSLPSRESPAPSSQSPLPLEYARALSNDNDAEVSGKETRSEWVSGDDPFPAEPVAEIVGSSPSIPSKVLGAFRIPEDPSRVAYIEPPISTMSVRGEKGIFTLHISSFSERAEASGYVTQLRRMGYKAFLVATHMEDRGTIYRVRVGPFLSKNEAEKYRQQFEAKEGIPTYVVKRVVEEKHGDERISRDWSGTISDVHD